MNSSAAGNRDQSLTDVPHAGHGAPRGRGPVLVQLSTVRPGAQRAPADLPRSRWQDFATEQPGFAEQIRIRFGQQSKHVLATLSVQGSPRVSGTGVFWFEADVWIYAPPNAPRVQDLETDPRFVLHVNPGDGSKRDGDVKVSGIVEPVPSGQEYDKFIAAHQPGRQVELFRLLLEEVEHSQAVSNSLRVTTWRPGAQLAVTQGA